MQEMQETWVQFLGWEDPLEEEMAAHSSILAWRIPWTEELGGLRSIAYQSQQDWRTEHTSKFTWFKTDQKHRKVMKKLSPNLPILESPNPFWGGGRNVHSLLCVLLEKKKSLSCVQLFASPRTVAHQDVCWWNSPDKNTGVSCHSLLQRIVPTQGLSPDLLHCRQLVSLLSEPLRKPCPSRKMFAKYGFMQKYLCKWYIIHIALHKGTSFNKAVPLFHFKRDWRRNKDSKYHLSTYADSSNIMDIWLILLKAIAFCSQNSERSSFQN